MATGNIITSLLSHSATQYGTVRRGFKHVPTGEIFHSASSGLLGVFSTILHPRTGSKGVQCKLQAYNVHICLPGLFWRSSVTGTVPLSSFFL